MSTKRKDAILESLGKGNAIYRQWVGGNSGRLSHTLEGVRNLRESEVSELRALLEPVPESRSQFKALRLKR